MEQATFSFEKYQVEKFAFDIENIPEENISIKIDPKGKFIVAEKKFILSFHFFAFDKEKSHEDSFVECLMKAEFIFSDTIASLEDVPNYFYANSIAIVFPYLRAFISSLTIQANLKPVILPTMNLTALSTPLKDNIIVE